MGPLDSNIVPVPTLVKYFSNENSNDPPFDIALGPSCSIVLTSKGRCLSFGRSDDGLLGLGHQVKQTNTPKQITFSLICSEEPPDERSISYITIGARHAVCVTKKGRVYSWGAIHNGRLGISKLKPEAISLENNTIPEEIINPSTIYGTIWSPLIIPLTDMLLYQSNNSSNDNSILQNNLYSEKLENQSSLVARAYAGNDSTIFIMRSGAVLSCGRKTGRLGQGEVVSDVYFPQPLFGGLKLWQ